jgi:hypothetical protein
MSDNRKKEKKTCRGTERNERRSRGRKRETQKEGAKDEKDGRKKLSFRGQG